MRDAIPHVPAAKNEPILAYAPGTTERAVLKRELETMAQAPIEIPLHVGGRELRPGQLVEVTAPHDHRRVLARSHQARREDVAAAIEAARAARATWSHTPWPERLAVFLRAAELLATRFRPVLNAATMLGQSKTAHQAEIDAACETIDFWRWNAQFAARLYNEQPYSPTGTWNQLDLRPLEGFVLAVTPFNFTSIAANLPTAPAMLGNTVLWKPARTAVLSAHYILQILREAGLPDGVINFIPGPASTISEVALGHPELAGVHFTGSTGVFQTIWQAVARELPHYKSYPRLVGETGGKDFIVAHPSADLDALAVAIVRGSFEYQGQKCSAVSRVYVPDTRWRGGLRDRVCAMIAELKVGDVADFRNFMGAVIDQASFENIARYLKLAKDGPGTKIIAGGGANGERGWFVEPTLVESDDPRSRLMCEEIFGPVVTVHAYPEAKWEETLRLCDQTSPYALTGAVFARDRTAIARASEMLRDAAGNFYVNDKPTGAVVGQQPFGGARASGTNDKAGSLWNLIRWVSPRTIKENLAPPVDWRYPSMSDK
jgi:1-pyrroline-5-carboxylate dehydrogenase